MGLTIWQEAEQKSSAACRAFLAHLDTCEECCPMVKDCWCEKGKRLIVACDNAPRFPKGIDVVRSGQCPMGTNWMACAFCAFGHFTECHYPETCEQAKCSHYQPE